MSYEQQPATEHYDTPLDNPQIYELYDRCLAESDSDTEYMQKMLALVHACDLEYGDENAGHSQETIVATALLLADVHYQTGHYDYCLGEAYNLITHYSAQGDQINRLGWDYIDSIVVATMGDIGEIQFCPVSSQILTQ